MSSYFLVPRKNNTKEKKKKKKVERSLVFAIDIAAMSHHPRTPDFPNPLVLILA